ncbi:MAG: hypothetical protein ABW089_10485 [Sedimenticola sp.]
MIRPGRRHLTPAGLIVTALLLNACSEQPAEEAGDELEKQLDTRMEVLHQTRKVLRYTEEQAELERKEMQELLDSSGDPQ